MEATEPQSLEEMAEGLLMPDPVEEETPEVEAEEAEAEEVETEAEEEDAGEADEADPEEDEEAEQEADEAPQMFTVKVDGVEQEVSLDELTRGYAGQSYIQKGMTEAAETRKQAEAKRVEAETVFEALNQQRNQLSQLVQSLQEGGLRKPTPVDPAMFAEDPIGAMQAQAEYQRDIEQYNAKASAVQAQQQQAAYAQNQAREAYIQEQNAILQAKIPEFSDPVKGRAIQEDLRSTGTQYGFNENEIAGITDARMVQVLHDAMLYRKTKAKTQEVTTKAATARPVVKSKAKPVQAPARVEREKQRQKLRQSGRIEDAIDLMFE